MNSTFFNNCFRSSATLILLAIVWLAPWQDARAACGTHWTWSASGLTVTFKDSSYAANSFKRYWGFGDGTTSDAANPHHVYSKGGSYRVCLYVVDSIAKCYASYCDSVTVSTPCAASFTYSIGSGYLVSFTDKSTSKNYHRCEWDFGDTYKSTLQNPTHTFAHAGNYKVCLHMTDTVTNCTSDYCATVSIVSTNCHAKYYYSVSGNKVSFTDSSTAQNSYRRYWGFGDGTTSDAAAPQHSYSSSGYKRVCLYIFDSIANCTSGYCDSIYVGPSPCLATFTYGVNGKTVYLKADNTSTSATYNWSMGDGNYKSGQGVSYTYAHDSVYNVCLYVKDSSKGCNEHSCITIVTANYYHSISGTVSLHTNDSNFSAIVWLITFNPKDSSLKAVKDQRIYAHGKSYASYTFSQLVPGTYYTKAALDSGSNYYKDYIPTYHYDATKWAKAQSITVSSSNVTGADIKMKHGNNPGGKGFIGGKISQGANKKAVGDPIAGVEVILYDNLGSEVAYTSSDANGVYQFSDLAYGTYEIYPEVLAIKTYSTMVTLSESQQTIKNANIKINSTSAVVALTGVEEQILPAGAVGLYPNPAGKELSLDLRSISSQTAQLTIYDMTGKMMLTQKAQNLKNGDQILKLNTSGLTSGIYLVRLQTEAGVWQSRFMKE